MTSAGTQIARPACAAFGLCVNMALFEKLAALRGLQTLIVTKLVVGVADGPVARVPASIRRYREIAPAGAARVRRTGAPMQLLQRNRQVCQRNGSAGER